MNISVNHLPEYDNHYRVISLSDRKAHLKGYIAIHRRGLKKHSFGATRIWFFPYEKNALKEALLLSRTMSYKLAMAGLDYGGAKAVIVEPKKPYDRVALIKAYLKYVNRLNGQFITGADVGVSLNDVIMMKRFCPYIVGIKADPVKYTGLSLYYSLQVVFNHLYGSSAFDKRTIAIQGLGKIGQSLLKRIYGKVKKIYVADIDKNQIIIAKKLYPNVKVVDPNHIYKKKVDVFSPCALGQILNNQTISGLRCDIILGGANNQLASEEIGDKLYKMGIFYAPDYVVNAGGLISVVYEFGHEKIREKQIEKKINQIKNTLKLIIKESKNKNLSPSRIANQMAKEMGTYN